MKLLLVLILSVAGLASAETNAPPEKWSYAPDSSAESIRSVDIPEQLIGVSPDGERVYLWKSDAIEVWDSELSGVVTSIPHPGKVSKFCVTEAHVYAGAVDGTVTAFVREDAKELWKVRVGSPNESGLINIDAAPDGKSIAVSSRTELAIISTKGKLRSKMKSTGGFVLFSPDSKFVLLHQPHQSVASFYRATRKLDPKKVSTIAAPKDVGRSVFARVPGRKKLVSIAGNGVYEVGPKQRKWKRILERTREGTEYFLVSPTEDGLLWFGRDPGPAMVHMSGKKPKTVSSEPPHPAVVGLVVANPKGRAYYYVKNARKGAKTRLTRIPIATTSEPPSGWDKLTAGVSVGSWVRWRSDNTLETARGWFDPRSSQTTSFADPKGEAVASTFGFDVVRRGTGASAKYVLRDRVGASDTVLKIETKKGANDRWRVRLVPGGEFIVLVAPPDPGSRVGLPKFRFELFEVATQSVVRTWSANQSFVDGSGTSYWVDRDTDEPATVAVDRSGQELWRSSAAGSVSGRSDDGEHLISGNGLVDAATGEMLRRWENPRNAIPYLRLLSAGSKTVLIGWRKPAENAHWFEVRDRKSGDVIATGELPDSLQLVDVSPDGSCLVALDAGVSGSRYVLYRKR